MADFINGHVRIFREDAPEIGGCDSAGRTKTGAECWSVSIRPVGPVPAGA